MNLAADGRIDAVVIGASAGGVEALSVLLPALPPRLRAPVFIVLHLPRDQPSVLAEIFARKCALPVREAEDKEPVARRNGLLCAEQLSSAGRRGAAAVAVGRRSGASFAALDRCAVRIRGRGLRQASAGHHSERRQRGRRRGLAAIHDAGGVTVVQSPETARAPQMALSALKLTARGPGVAARGDRESCALWTRVGSRRRRVDHGYADAGAHQMPAGR